MEPVASGDQNHYKFSGKERDTESGNDDFGARYYSAVMGRFMSPDWSAQPEPVPYAKLGNPQSLNLYAYAENNPISGFDPDGHAGAVGDCGVGAASVGQTDAYVSQEIKATCKQPPVQDPSLGKHYSIDGFEQSDNTLANSFMNSGTVKSGNVWRFTTNIFKQLPNGDIKQSVDEQTIDLGFRRTICGDFICSPDGRRIGVAPCGGCIHEEPGLILMGVSVGLKVDMIGAEAADEAAAFGPSGLFRPSSWFNQGKYWRLGWGKGPPGSGKWVFRLVINNSKWDLWNGPPR